MTREKVYTYQAPLTDPDKFKAACDVLIYIRKLGICCTISRFGDTIVFSSARKLDIRICRAELFNHKLILKL